LLQHRPVLLVEIEPRLAREVAALEAQSAETRLDAEMVAGSPSITGRAFEDVAEARFLDTYRQVHCTVLGIDQDREKYIFGVPDERFEKALLSLIFEAQTLE